MKHAYAAFALVLVLRAAADTPPSYPEGFLQWKQVKATRLELADPGTAKLTAAHFVYADEKALEGLRTGKYPEGAVLVLDILKVEHKDGAAKLGTRDSTSTMVRDSRRTESGGWVFQDFDIVTKTELKIDAARDCFACHTQKAANQYVFTLLPH